MENKAEKNIGFGRVLGRWPYFPDSSMLTLRGVLTSTLATNTSTLKLAGA